MLSSFFNRSFMVTIARLLAVMVLLLAGALSYAQPAAASPEAQVDYVAVNGTITTRTWTAGTTYYVTGPAIVPAANTLTIQGGAIVKFAVGAAVELLVEGNLVIENASAANPVYFTSIRDDSRGGGKTLDSNNPNFGDWGAVVLMNRTAGVAYVDVRYSTNGLVIYNTTTGLLNGPIQNNVFKYNTCGLTLSIDSTGGINPLITNNTFEENEYGFCTDQYQNNETAPMNPTLQNNTFTKNHKLPLLLEGSAFPIYGTGAQANTFSGYDEHNQVTSDFTHHLGIGLRGTISQSATWPLVAGYGGAIMPYVVVGPLEIRSSYTVTVLAGTLFKFYTITEMEDPSDPLPGIKASGTLALPDAPDGYTGDPLVIFTSYHDDVIGGDTNGDEDNTEPLAGDWGSVQIIDDLLTAGAPFTFEHIGFGYGTNGLHYEATNNGEVRVVNFDHLTFRGNINGLRIKADNSVGARVNATIQYSAFEKNGRIPEVKADEEHGVPIFLDNAVFPTYIDNEFYIGNSELENMHMAIGVAGTWRDSTTWGPVDVVNVGPVQFPYLVHRQLVFGRDIADGVTDGKDDTVTLTIPAGAFIKFNVNRLDTNTVSSILAYGTLNLQSNIGTDPITFTSIYDDDGDAASYNPDTSYNAIAPTRADWLAVEAHHPNSRFTNLVVRYAREGLHIRSAGDYDINVPVQNSLFENNTYGLYLGVDEAGDITGPITACTFKNNDYGLVTFAETDSTGISQPVLTNNQFINHSQFPIYLNGSASLTYANLANGSPSNTFTGSVHPAIALGGYFGSDATDPYSLPKVLGDSAMPGGLPYVVQKSRNVKFDWSSHTVMAGGLVVKFMENTRMDFLGSLQMNTTSTNRNYFTAYEDDTCGSLPDNVCGNTDAAPQPTLRRDDWNGIYISNPATPSFSFSTVAHAVYGLALRQDPLSFGNLVPTIEENLFTENQHGLTFWIESNYDMTPEVRRNNFTNNDYGLYVYTKPPNPIWIGTANPVLRRNAFNGHAQFPIYLNGSANPTYITGTDKNTFTGSVHPAIALSGYWYREATWTRVEGDRDGATGQVRYFPYVVVEHLYLELYNLAPLEHATIRIPARSLIKFVKKSGGLTIQSAGLIIFESSPGNEIIFTSYNDDRLFYGDIGGDTNGATTLPAKGDWEAVAMTELSNKYHDIHDVKTWYAESAWSVFYSYDNGDVRTSITRATMETCITGISLVVAWRKEGDILYGAKGSILSPITDVVVSNSDYGMVTAAHPLSTGIAAPTLTNVTFRDINIYPLFLGGTSQPNFASGNLVEATGLMAPQALQGGNDAGGAEGLPPIEMEFPTLPELPMPDEPALGPAAFDQNLQPGASLVTAAIPEDLAPAIALGGAWNAPVILPPFTEIPFVIPGNFPFEWLGYGIRFKPDPKITVGEEKPDNYEFATLTIPAGSAFKFASTYGLIVKDLGDLTLLSTDATPPVIFTSFADDSVGGDTNHNGALTRPAKGDWTGILHATQNTSSRFEYSIVRYSTEGLHYLADSDYWRELIVNASHNRFTENVVGLTLEAVRAADLVATVEYNRFNGNTTHILGKPNGGSSSRLRVEAHYNDLLGGSSQVGINNQITLLNGNMVAICTQPAGPCDFNATNNYWGHSGGPTHNLNPGGQGSTVSINVAYTPFSGTPFAPPELYTIKGRVTQELPNGDTAPLVGVELMLVPLGVVENSQGDGYYEFLNVPAGTYTIIPTMDGFTFDPSQMYLSLQSSATNLNFHAIPVESGRTVSVQSMSVIKNVNRDYTINVVVSLDQPNNIGATIRVTYNILNGSATGGLTNDPNAEDFTFGDDSAVLSFSGGQQTKTIPIVIKRSDPNEPDEFFTIQLSNPVNVQILEGTATITTVSPVYTFLPLLRK